MFLAFFKKPGFGEVYNTGGGRYSNCSVVETLDLVEKILGSNILLHNTTFIIKEADTTSHVSWHQDLTYWRFSHDDQVSVWLALSPANELSGALQMIPKSHTPGMVALKKFIILDKLYKSTAGS